MATSSTYQRDRLTWVLYAMAAIFAFYQSSLGPVIVFLRDELSLSFTVGGLHASAFAAGSILGSFQLDVLVRRFTRRWVLWGGGAGMLAGSSLLMTGPHAALTIAGSLGMGYAGLFLLSLLQSTLSDHHDVGNFGAVAVVEANIAASLAATASAVAIGAFAGAGLGWRAALLLPAALWLTMFLTQRPLPIPPPQTDEQSEQTTTARGLGGAFWVFWGITFLGVGVEWSLAIWGASFLNEAGGFAPEAAATLFGIFFVAMVTARAVTSRLARHYPLTVLLAGALILALVGFVPFWLSPAPALMLLGLFVAGLGIANIYPLGVSAAIASAPPHRRDLASGRVSMAAAAAILLAPQTLGLAADEIGLRGAYGVALGLLLAGVALALWSIKNIDLRKDNRP